MRGKIAGRGSVLAAAITGVLLGHALFLAPAAQADCLPCVVVENDYPYVFVEVCPPV